MWGQPVRKISCSFFHGNNYFLGFIATSNAFFDDIYIYDTTGNSFSANDAGLEYVNITLRNSEMKTPNTLGKRIIVNMYE